MQPTKTTEKPSNKSVISKKNQVLKQFYKKAKKKKTVKAEDKIYYKLNSNSLS